MISKNQLVVFYIWFLRLIGHEVIHFIHIGKTGGSAITSSIRKGSSWAKNVYRENKIVLVCHGHEFTFMDVGDKDKAFFVVRDPVSRFVSGFYSRKRKGRPKNNNPWSNEEHKAFTKYPEIQDLVRGLHNHESAAFESLSGINHVRTSYWDWFGNEEYMLKNWHKIDFILKQDSLSKFWLEFINYHELSLGELPSGSMEKHSNPIKFTGLVPEQKEYLKEVFDSEYRFLALVEEKYFSIKS